MPHDSDPAGTVISADALVIYALRKPDRPLGVAPEQMATLRGRKALLLLGLSATIEGDGAAEELARDLKSAKADLPDIGVVVLTNTTFETYVLANLQICAMPGSRSIFVDENVFKPWDGPGEFDALYNASLTPESRHDLARDVTRLALIYGRPNDPAHLADTKAKLPRATFVNHGEGQGAYRHLSAEECDRHINRARVGLCLSRTGATVAAMEYMLVGLPIVSTQSHGGRERYLLPPFCRLVDDNPAAIADAVDVFARKPIPKAAIRKQALHMLQFERYNFLIAINNLAKERFGVETLFASFAPFEVGLTRAHADRIAAPERAAS